MSDPECDPALPAGSSLPMVGFLTVCIIALIVGMVVHMEKAPSEAAQQGASSDEAMPPPSAQP